MNTNQSLLGQLLMHAHKVFAIMSMLAFHPDETTFGYLACRYAPKGLENKIIELQDLEFRFCFTTKSMFICDGWLATIQLVNNLIKDGLTTKAETLFGMLLKLGIFKRTCLLMRWPMLMLESLVQRLNENLIRTQVLLASHLQLQLNLEGSMVCNPSGLDTEEPLPVAVFALTTCELGSLITHASVAEALWDDEDTKSFYECLPNLRAFVLAVLLGEVEQKGNDQSSKASDQPSDSTTPESDQIVAQDTAETSVSEKKKDDDEKDKGKEKEKEKDDEIKAEIEKEKLRGPEGTNLDGLIQRLPGCVSRGLIDQLTLPTKKLVRALFNVPRTSLELLPYYSRMVATLSTCMKDVPSMLLLYLEEEFNSLINKKDQMNIETKIRNIRFIGELCKFKTAQVGLVFSCLKVMFYGLAVVTFGTAVPAGQFVPGIMIGSTYGHLVGMFVVRLYEKLNIEEGIYALLGAALFVGGSMRMAVSLCVIMVEITNNLKLLPLIMLVLLISKLIGLLLHSCGESC
ncbi:uncharacterized protein LOC111902592 [Lactuca sativa]|uniref:uncharacterized protein LOC111902592 n=1 Tax=Lactuca sativa TaxID=4236 RepID=UPI001C68B566|nr:uncharacterized protein LOC111902592 [Lactuca sativa]